MKPEFEAKLARAAKKNEKTSPSATQPETSRSPGHELLRLQEVVGNGAVQRLIQRKLDVSHPDDPYEQEADRVAQQVATMPTPEAQPAAQSQTAPEKEDEQTKLATTKADRTSQDEADNGVSPHAEAAVSAAATSAGQPLPSKVHRKFEHAFGVDLSAVRVHTGSESVEASKAIGARAYTSGTDIHFNQGQYNPESTEGQRLLAHEVTHTLQQQGAVAQRDPLADQVPQQIQPTNISLSFTIPGGKRLTSDWNDLGTTDPTTVTMTLTPTGIRLRFSPALRIDAQWPVSDMAWDGLDYDFATGAIRSIDIRSTQGLAVTAYQSEARAKISDFWTRMLAGTRTATAGYNPLTDTNPGQTLNSIKNNWNREPSGSDVRPGEVRNIEASASASIREQISAGSPGGPEGGIVIAAGGSVTVTATLSGGLDDVQAANQPRVRTVTVDSESIFLQSRGEYVAKLQTVYVNYGGSVQVGRFELMGGARTAAGAETVVNFIGLLALLASGSPSDRLAVAGSEPHIEPTIVPGMARREIEAALTTAIRSFFASNPFILPGIDIGEVFGMRAPGDFPTRRSGRAPG